MTKMSRPNSFNDQAIYRISNGQHLIKVQLLIRLDRYPLGLKLQKYKDITLQSA